VQLGATMPTEQASYMAYLQLEHAEATLYVLSLDINQRFDRT